MDNKLIELITSAEQSTKFREHVLSRDWKLYPSLNRLVAENKCIYCNREVRVNTNPLPNDIDISGEAIALTCDRVCNKCDGLLDSEGFCILCGDDTKSIWKDNND